MVKIIDVALRADTSVATVSRALNNHDSVNPELAARVVAAADELGYRPNQLARNLRRRRTNMWVLIISDIEIAFFTSAARGVEDIAAKNGYSLVLCNTDEDKAKEEQYLDLVVSERAAGLIISPHSSHTPIERLTATGIPVVVIDRRLDGPVDSVVADSRGGARAATEHLFAQGWQRPACITGPRTTETAMLRRLGYEDAMRGPNVRGRVVHRSFTIDGGREATAALLDQNRPPDSLFVANAALALGVLQELKVRKLRPGVDLGLICFDDAPWAPFIDPPISVVAQPAYRIGEQAGTILLARIARPDLQPRQVMLGTDLIIRESSLRAT